MGQKNYLSLLSGAKFVLGNSSSGLLEAPSFKVPTINVGNRQDGRPRAKTVIDVDCEVTSIKDAIALVTSEPFMQQLSDVTNPYGPLGASERISVIIEGENLENLLPKRFFDAS